MRPRLVTSVLWPGLIRLAIKFRRAYAGLPTKRDQRRICRALPVVAAIMSSAFLLMGCSGTPTTKEVRARYDLAAIERVYRPSGEHADLPPLSEASSLREFLLYAILNQPQVEAAYFDWSASVERITVERSLPDPRLTFQTDIAGMVMSLVPGLMTDLPGPGKLAAAADVATAESSSKYYAFEWQVMRAAFALKKAYYDLDLLAAKTRVIRDTLELLNDIETQARAQNDVGRGSLQDVLRTQIEQQRLATELANLEDSHNLVLTQFKAALGLREEDSRAPVPHTIEYAVFTANPEQLITTALTRNPRLNAMQAEIQRADASLRLAFKSRVPDFNLGIEADVKAAPILAMPQLGVTLPIWRDKIAALIARAQADKHAVEARLSAEQIRLAVEFAEQSFMFREASRTLGLLTEQLLPKATQSLQIAQLGYVSSKVEFIDLLDAERTLLEFNLAEVEARVQRELTLARLSLLIIGTPPADAPVLPGREQMGDEAQW